MDLQKEIEKLKFFNRDCKEEIERMMDENENLKNRIKIHRNHLKELGVDVEAYDTKYDHLL